ncbi:MAG: glucose-1-phosphate thymidylyltransferase RfbA [Fusobacteria bacterium]|jgi:glucose-1-phosphate thymidylyltransferase|nr:glucose-1-phosphate thymidylyltransferase RfbA [Fusobacteriota bacterium]
MKGIILAGGYGTRLYPITKALSKQLLPVYDKPMIYYPLSVLMLAGIRDILIIVMEKDYFYFEKLLGDGSDYGINISYEIQNSPKGLPDAFIIGEKFIGDSSVCLILGDNIFWGQGFGALLSEIGHLNEGANIFAYYVKDPREFGVVEFDKSRKILSLEEKPKIPKSNYAVPGLYFYDNTVIEKAKSLEPSSRGELEIMELNKIYHNEGSLKLELFGRGMAWLDTGTHDGLLEASNFVSAIQKRQGLYVSCIEEIAYRKGYIDKDKLIVLADKLKITEYGQYLHNLINFDKGV